MVIKSGKIRKWQKLSSGLMVSVLLLGSNVALRKHVVNYPFLDHVLSIHSPFFKHLTYVGRLVTGRDGTQV